MKNNIVSLIHQTEQTMKNTKQTYTIWHTTSFGNGIRKIKAFNFDDAFNRLSETDKSKLISITQCETGEEKYAEEFNIYA